MIRGDVRVLLDALGAREGDPALDRAFAFVGGAPEIETFTDDADGTATYVSFVPQGVEFLLKDGEVSSIFVAAADTPDLRAYRGWSELIPPVDATSARSEIVAALGEPIRATPGYVTYPAETGYVQFDFSDEALTMLVVMRELVGGAPAQPPADVVAAPSALTGDVTTFFRAIGQPMFSPAHIEVIGLVGPASASRDEIVDGVAWQYEDSPRAGVLLQFRQELLVGALIRVRDDDQGVYAAPDRLIDGLPLPANREAVIAFLGTPRQSREDMDLFLIDDRYLRVDYADGISSALTVAQPGVGV